jgi:hypothetical protein
MTEERKFEWLELRKDEKKFENIKTIKNRIL